MFSNSIFLTINTRLNSDEDRETLKQFKLDFLNVYPIETTSTKYFKMVDKFITNDNIALRNEICENVSRTIRNINNKTVDYGVGANE